MIQATLELMVEIDLRPGVRWWACAGVAALHQEDDGLKPELAWQGKLFVNPPPSQAQAFVERLVREHKCKEVTEAVLLVPAWTDTEWFRLPSKSMKAFLMKPEFSEVEGMPDPLVAIYFGDRHAYFGQVFSQHGDVYVPYGE